MTEELQQDAPKPRLLNELSVLFPLLSLYTIVYLALTTANFFLGTTLPLSDRMMSVYIALLGAYATDKEVRRWVGRPEPPRKGTFFVYLWLILFLVLFTIQNFAPSYKIPDYLHTVSLQVLAIFFGSKASKHLHGRRVSQSESTDIRQEKVLGLIKAKGAVTRADVEGELKLSAATAGRLLLSMEKAGLVEKQGQSKDTTYTLPKNIPEA